MLAMIAGLLALIFLEVDPASAKEAKVPTATAVEETELGIRCEIASAKSPDMILRVLVTRIEPDGRFHLQAVYFPEWCQIQGRVAASGSGHRKLRLKYRSGNCDRTPARVREIPVDPTTGYHTSSPERLPSYGLVSKQFIATTKDLAEGTPLTVRVSEAEASEILKVSLVKVKFQPLEEREKTEAGSKNIQIRNLRTFRDLRPDPAPDRDTSRIINTLVGSDDRFHARVEWGEEKQTAFGYATDRRATIKCATDVEGLGVSCETTLGIKVGTELMCGGSVSQKYDKRGGKPVDEREDSIWLLVDKIEADVE